MSARELIGRRALRKRIDSDAIRDALTVADPEREAIAHLICSMGGHIPNRDPEQPGSCDFHRRQAEVALEQARLAGSRVPPRHRAEVSA